MTQSEGLEPREIAELWRKKFGEPPPILTDAETMFRVMISLPPRSFAPPGEAAEGAVVALDGFPRRRRDDFDPWSIGGGETTP